MPSVHTTISESVITVEELAEHGTLDKLWIAVHGRVYNLTAFSSDHPGGVDALEMSAGRDGTEAYEYAGHSEENMGKMQQYYVGNIAGSLEHAFTSPVETSKGSSAVSDLQLLNAPRIRLTAAIIATSFIGAVLSHCCTPSAQNVSSPQSPTTLNQNPRYAFWAGIVVASSISLGAFTYLYLLFLSSFDHRNDVFSFPPTIPRKQR